MFETSKHVSKTVYGVYSASISRKHRMTFSDKQEVYDGTFPWIRVIEFLLLSSHETVV